MQWILFIIQWQRLHALLSILSFNEKKDLTKEQANTAIAETESSLAPDWDNKGVIKGNRMVSIVR